MQLNDKLCLISRVSIALIATSFLVSCGDSTKQASEQKRHGFETSQTDLPPPVLTAQVNTSPLFETAQGWGPGFAKATGHGPGVVVGPGGGNANVFAQQFSASPGEQFKLVARASSVGQPNAKGRFQINWVGGDKFISASIKTFDVTSQESTFEYYATAPTGAQSGTLYVVPEGATDVVRYTEMRLLGKEGRARTN